jgi:hypothetical protein
MKLAKNGDIGTGLTTEYVEAHLIHHFVMQSLFMDNSEVTKDIHSNHHLFTEKRRVPGIHQYQDISNYALQDKKDTVALHMVLVQLQSQR